MEVMGGGVAFLICIIFVMQFKIFRKFWRRGGVKLIKDKTAFKHSQQASYKGNLILCPSTSGQNVLGLVSKVPGNSRVGYL